MLEELRDKIKEIMLGEVREIIFNTRNGNMTVVEEKKGWRLSYKCRYCNRSNVC